MDTVKLSESIKALEDIDPSFSDLFEELGILVDDTADMLKAKNPQQFIKQKRDCRVTLKRFRRRIDNLTYKNRNK